MKTASEIGRAFREARRAHQLSRADIAPLLGCSVKTVGNFENSANRTDGDTVLRAMQLMTEWQEDVSSPKIHEEQRPPYGPPAGVVRVGELADPGAVLIGGLQNALVLARDESVPLRSRLVHIRTQLQFLIDNFLGDASLPGGPEGG